MSPLEETKARRFQFLNKLYDMVEGHQRGIVSMWEVGDLLGFERSQTGSVCDYLVGEGLIEHRAIGGEISLTHFGLKEVEGALSTPDEPTTYFPPVINILNVQSMVGSQIQQGTHHSTQTLNWTQPQIASIEEFVALLKAQLPKVKLPAEAQKEASADLATVEAQLNSGKPKPGIIRESLHSLRAICEGAVGDIAAAGILHHLIPLLASLAGVPGVGT